MRPNRIQVNVRVPTLAVLQQQIDGISQTLDRYISSDGTPLTPSQVLSNQTPSSTIPPTQHIHAHSPYVSNVPLSQVPESLPGLISTIENFDSMITRSSKLLRYILNALKGEQNGNGTRGEERSHLQELCQQVSLVYRKFCVVAGMSSTRLAGIRWGPQPGQIQINAAPTRGQQLPMQNRPVYGQIPVGSSSEQNQTQRPTQRTPFLPPFPPHSHSTPSQSQSSTQTQTSNLPVVPANVQRYIEVQASQLAWDHAQRVMRGETTVNFPTHIERERTNSSSIQNQAVTTPVQSTSNSIHQTTVTPTQSTMNSMPQATIIAAAIPTSAISTTNSLQQSQPQTMPNLQEILTSVAQMPQVQVSSFGPFGVEQFSNQSTSQTSTQQTQPINFQQLFSSLIPNQQSNPQQTTQTPTSQTTTTQQTQPINFQQLFSSLIPNQQSNPQQTTQTPTSQTTTTQQTQPINFQQLFSSLIPNQQSNPPQQTQQSNNNSNTTTITTTKEEDGDTTDDDVE